MLKRNSILVVALSCGVSSLTSAQSTELSAEEEQSVEVIEVFAQKRAQDINDVALAVTFLDQEAIEKNFLKDTTQLGALVPNLKITHNAGEGTPPAFNIRGIGMIDYNTSTVSPIGIYSDGIVSGSANHLSVNLFDVESVEVLRGPQGTLFGRNTTGGAILFKSAQPEQEFGGYVKASAATKEHTSFTSAINVPVSSSTAVRLAVNHEDYKFSTNNLMPGQDDGGLKQSHFRFIINSEFDELTINAKLHGGKWKGIAKPIESLGVLQAGTDPTLGTTCDIERVGTKDCVNFLGEYNGGDDYWDVYTDNGDKKHDSDLFGADLTLNWNYSDQLSFSSITGYKTLERFHAWDSDGPYEVVEGSMGTDNSLFSQELSASYLMGNYHLIAGLYYVEENTKQNNDIDVFRMFRGIVDPGPGQYFYDNELDVKSIALYSQLDYDLDKDTVVTVGLRFTDEETSYRVKADVSVVVDGNDVLAPVWDSTNNDWNGPTSVEDQEASGKLAINHKLGELNSVYASYSRGYKSGGYNAGYGLTKDEAEDAHYRPEKLNAYEVGTKLWLADSSVNFNVAAFYYDYKDQQIFINKGYLQHVLKNAGDSTIYGLDAELAYTPFQNLHTQLNIGYLPEANIGKYEDEQNALDDNRLPMTSEWNISGLLVHETELFKGQLISQLSFDYQSEFYFDQNENPYTQQDAFIVWNGRLTYQPYDDIEFSLWGKNLTNTEHSDLLFDSRKLLQGISELKAESRQIGVEARYQF